METNLRLLKQYIDEPPSFEDGKVAADFLRRRVVQKSSYDTTSDSDVSDSDSSLQPDKRGKPTKKRKRREADDAELEARREKRRLADLEKRAMIKSSVRVIDSDDDDSDDEAFFARERELRMRMAQRAEASELPSSGTKKVGKKPGKKKRPETKEGTVLSNIVAMDTENIEDLGLMTNEDESENGDIELVRPAKKRMVRRALSISSDDE